MIKIFIKFVKQHLKTSLLYFFLLTLSNICIIYQPLSLSKVLEKSQFSFDTDILIFIGLSILTPCIISFKDRTLNYVTNLMSVRVANDMMQKMLHKDILQIKKYSSNYIIRVINNYSWLVSDFYLYTFLDTLISLITALVMLWLLAQRNAYIALFVLICHLLRLLGIYLIQGNIVKSSEEKIDRRNTFLGAFSNYLIKIKHIVIRSKQQDCYSILSNQSRLNLNATKKNAHWKSFSSSMGQTSFYTIQFATVLVGLLLSNRFGITVAILQLSFSYATEIGKCLQMVSELFPAFAELKAYDGYVQSLLEIKNMKSIGLTNRFKQIKLDHLSFGYDEKKILQHLNYEFNTGYIYVIKGENGTGKSTLIKVISGLYSQYDGQILLDGIPLEDYNIEYFFNHLISILTQDDLLFEGSIRDNLLDENEGHIEEVAKYFGLNDIDKQITSNGTNLSGGEKRKVLLARTFLNIINKKPPLVIFDEPTYALETETVRKVIDAINKLSKHCIVIIVSHEKETIKNAIEIQL